jgi:hypothetical protein
MGPTSIIWTFPPLCFTCSRWLIVLVTCLRAYVSRDSRCLSKTRTTNRSIGAFTILSIASPESKPTGEVASLGSKNRTVHGCGCEKRTMRHNRVNRLGARSLESARCQCECISGVAHVVDKDSDLYSRAVRSFKIWQYRKGDRANRPCPLHLQLRFPYYPRGQVHRLSGDSD